jgi:hypothetical protein
MHRFYSGCPEDTMSNKPPVEYAATDRRSGADAFRSLADQTGLSVERIEELAGRYELAVLFSPVTHRLRPAAEIRSLEAAGRLQAGPPQLTPQQRQVELYRDPPRGPIVAEINAGQRARLAWLMAQVTDHGGAEYLTANEHKELLYLLQISGLIPDMPLESVPGQHISGRSTRLSGREAMRQLVELRAGFHNPPISGKQALLELYRLGGQWHLTPKQRQLQRMRERWR